MPNWEIMWLTKAMIHHSKGWQDQGPFYKGFTSTKFRFCKNTYQVTTLHMERQLSCHYICRIRDISAGLSYTPGLRPVVFIPGSWQTPLALGNFARYSTQILNCTIKCCIWDNNNRCVAYTTFGCDLMNTNWITAQSIFTELELCVKTCQFSCLFHFLSWHYLVSGPY